MDEKSLHCCRKTGFPISVALIVCSYILNSHILFYLKTEDVYFISAYTNKTELLDIRCVPNNVVFRVFWNKIWPAIILVRFSLRPVICLIICSIILIRAPSFRNVIRTTIVKSKHNLKPLTKRLVIVCLFFCRDFSPSLRIPDYLPLCVQRNIAGRYRHYTSRIDHCRTTFS